MTFFIKFLFKNWWFVSLLPRWFFYHIYYKVYETSASCTTCLSVYVNLIKERLSFCAFVLTRNVQNLLAKLLRFWKRVQRYILFANLPNVLQSFFIPATFFFVFGRKNCGYGYQKEGGESHELTLETQGLRAQLPLWYHRLTLDRQRLREKEGGNTL